jgi:tripartite-type tricarboxylate transporter receptor subunit TctC
MRYWKRLERGLRSSIRFSGLTILLGSLILISAAPVPAAENWPAGPITTINGSAAGGFVDLISRTFGNEMSKVLGVPIVATNVSGGGGGIAAHNVFVAPNDGYTWQVQGAQIRTMGVLGYHDSSPKDWYVVPLAGIVGSISVKENSPYKTFFDLVEALKKNPNKITYGCSYPSSAWAIYMAVIKKAAGLQGRYVPYTGDPPGHVALLQGDIQFVMSGIGTQAEFLKGKKMRSLAVFDNKPYNVKDYGDIPAITDFLPELKSYLPFPAWTSFSLRADVPKPILKRIDEAYLKVMHTKPLEEFYEKFYCFPMGIVGEEAQKLYYRQASLESWLLYDAGVAKKSPAQFGIPKP